MGCLARLTPVLTTSYYDFIDGSRSQFQDLDSRIGKGIQRERERKGKHKVRHEGKKPKRHKKKFIIIIIIFKKIIIIFFFLIKLKIKQNKIYIYIFFCIYFFLN